MKKILNIFILLIFSFSLVACLSNEDEENNVDLNDQNQSVDEENNSSQNNEENLNEEVVDTDEEVEVDVEKNEDNTNVINNNNETNKSEEQKDNVAENEINEVVNEIVMENDAFKVFEPTPNFEASEDITVRGQASVFEGAINYQFEDGHFIMDEGFVIASEGAPGWGDFEFTVNIEGAIDGSASVILYELSAKDGSRINELIIPVKIKK